MSTHEERLETVEYGLKQFKTETIKAYQEVAMELTMVKGLGEDSIKRLMNIRTQIDQHFNTTDQQIAEVKQDIKGLHDRFDRLEKLIFDRFPSP